MVQSIKVLALVPEDLSSSPSLRTHILEADLTPEGCPLTSTGCGTHVHPHGSFKETPNKSKLIV